jgi:chromosome partitioning protein
MKVCVVNQKGGVGKTTVSVNLAYGLAKAGKRTLLIDLDPQGHASVIYLPEVPPGRTVNELFADSQVPLAELIHPAQVGGVPVEHLSLIPANIRLSLTAEAVVSRKFRERLLERKLKAVEGEYDFIVMDCLPSLNTIAVNALYTTDFVLIVTDYGRYSLDGMADLFATLDEVKEGQAYTFKILRNKFRASTTKTNEYVEAQLAPVREHLLGTVIRNTEAIAQSQMAGEPVIVYDPRGNGAADFTALTAEILRHG